MKLVLRVLIALAVAPLVFGLSGIASAQTTDTAVPTQTAVQEDDPLPVSDPVPDPQKLAATDSAPVALPATGASLAVIGLLGATALELGLALVLFASSRRRA